MEIMSGKILWAFVIVLLLVIIIGGIIVSSRYEPGDPVEITHPTSETWNGTIYIGGIVGLPGYYLFTYQDTLETLVRSAGGITDNHSPVTITLLLNDSKQEQQTQKIDINRAENWLLETLPGIGKIISQRIIDYRTNNGRFTSTLELLEIDGIGTSIYEQIKEYITVSD